MGKKKKAKKQRKHVAGTVSCETCGALCCQYVATQIDEPTGKTDYDHIRWYLLHKDVYVFKDHEGDWYIEFATPCAELAQDGRCGRYDARPRICRRHGEEDAACEFHSDDEPYEIRFATAAEFECYLEAEGIKWRWKQ